MVLRPALRQTTYMLLEQEDWFEDEIRFVRRWLTAGMSALDIGANVGVYTIAMAAKLAGRGSIWAFEPSPESAALLRRSVALNQYGGTSVIEAAVSDRAGSVRLQTREDSELNAVAAEGRIADAGMAVPALILDAEMHRLARPDIDFVKIDVEGHERQAIAGGEDFFRSRSPLVMLEIKAEDDPDLRALELLQSMGYEAFALLPGALMLCPFDAGAIDGYQLNVFACKADRAERLKRDGLLAREARPPAGTASHTAWSRYAASAPYARELRSGWRSKAGFFAPTDAQAYFAGLAAYAEYRNADKSTDERLGSLHEAFQSLGEAMAGEDRLARLLSYARVAADMGRRELAVKALARAHARLAEEGADALREPFLAPSTRYEMLEPAERAAEWLLCGVTEQLEKLRGFSSVFMESTSLGLIQPILGLSFSSAEMQRRWQLVRLINRLQAAPEPSELLCRMTEENLNPGFWCGSTVRA
jgi:FkbM family methyltransferase